MSPRQPRYQPGQRIGGRFLVHQALMGGMGEVYLCLDEQDMYPYALKTFQGTSPGLRTIFNEEVANWIALEKHPNIVRCFWMQAFDNIPFMGLEWIAGDENRGTDLRSWLTKGQLDLKLALCFTIDICRGLIHAGQKVPGIVHRDLKPENVLVNQTRQVKITDFGLAMIAQRAELQLDEDINSDSLQRSRHIGNVVGTPAYMSPEQWRGEVKLDARTDMYAVGCILYDMIAGQQVYTAQSLGQYQQLHLEAPIPQVYGALAAEINSILAKCLAKRREDRFDHVELLLTELDRVYQALVGAAPPELLTEEFNAVDYYNRGATYANLGQPKRAIKDFNRAIELNPTMKEAYANRGKRYTDLGQLEQAIEDLNRAIELDPTFKEAYANRGICYSDLGQLERAIEDFDRAIELDPTFKEAYNNRGVRYARLGQHERAIEDYDRAIELDPTFKKALVNRGKRYASLGQHMRAIEDYHRAIELDPTYKEAYLSRGDSYAGLGQHKRAIVDYDRAIELDPTFEIAYNNRGTCYERLGQYKQAIEDFTRALQLDNTSKKAYLNRGVCFGHLGQHQRAIEDYNRAIELDPTYKEAYSGRGGRYAHLGQFEQAIEDLNRAIELDPTFKEAYANRGVCYSDLGQLERAIEDLNRAIELDPTFKEAYANRGMCYSDLGQLERAIEDFDRAIELDPNYATAYYNRGINYGNIGLHERALTDYDRAITLDTNLAPAYFDKGATLVNTGHLRESLPCFEKAYKLGHQGAAEAIQWVRQRLGMPSVQTPQPSINPEAMFEAFQQTMSLEAMRQAVRQFPLMTDLGFIQAIEQVIHQQVPLSLRPEFETRLMWLRQIAGRK